MIIVLICSWATREITSYATAAVQMSDGYYSSFSYRPACLIKEQ